MKIARFLAAVVISASLILVRSEMLSAQELPAPGLRYLLKDYGARVDWSDTNQLLAYDTVGPETYFRIATMDKDGGNQKCLTCNHPALPERHHGNPSWHPSGDYIVFQVLDPTVGGQLAGSQIYKLYTNPGSGIQNSLWLMTKDASRVWKLTNASQQGGVLHPHFSPDGRQLVWAERVKAGPDLMGTWAIKLASFTVANDRPAISQVQTLSPGNLQWYETHGFSPDGFTLIFTGMAFGGREKGFDIYTYDSKAQALKVLTNKAEQQWDEHAHYTSDGKHIVWMSSVGNGQRPEQITTFGVKTDYWMMDADGGNKRRLTYFNHPRARFRTIAADLSLSGDGKYLFGYIQDPGDMKKPGSIIRMDLK